MATLDIKDAVNEFTKREGRDPMDHEISQLRQMVTAIAQVPDYPKYWEQVH